MTREQATNRLEELKRRREALVDQLSAPDVNSATLSSGGGSQSYTNRSVADLKAKIKYLDAEISRLEAALGYVRDPGGIKTIYARFR